MGDASKAQDRSVTKIQKNPPVKSIGLPKTPFESLDEDKQPVAFTLKQRRGPDAGKIVKDQDGVVSIV